MDSQIFRHLLKTYMDSRKLLTFIGIAFPWVLVIGNDFELLASISANYHSGMRDIFVGILFAVGTMLVAYKGYSREEDMALNVAGAMAVCVAVFPTLCDIDASQVTVCSSGAFAWLGEGANNWLHRITALVFFAGIAYVCWFRRNDTLLQLDDEVARSKFEKAYLVLAIALVVVPLLVAAVHFIKPLQGLVFWLEVTSMVVFSLYWYVKGKEIRRSAIEDVTQSAT